MKNVDQWLDLLCCPACGGDLILENPHQFEDGHIKSGDLRCESCDHRFPIIAGIPRFASSDQVAAVENTIRAFGHEWNAGNEDVLNSNMIQPALFLDFIYPVQEDYFQNKTVLDAGCGQARFTLLAQHFGARRVVGIDLSEAVVPAFQNTRHLDNVLIIQGDLLQLPLKARFDYVFSVGVLHHTSDPAGAFKSVSDVVIPEGGISAWVYGRENNAWIIYGLNPLRKHITSRLPYPLLWGNSRFLAAILLLIIRGVYLPVERNKALLGFKSFLFYFDYLCWLGKYGGFREISLVVFDHLVPEIAEYILREDFENWFVQAGFPDPTITAKANNSWRGFGENKSVLTEISQPR